MGQLTESVEALRGDNRRLSRLAYSGTAIALATAPNPIALKPGQFALTAGAGSYRSENALGLNVSRMAEDGRSALNLGVGYADADAMAVRASVSVIFGD